MKKSTKLGLLAPTAICRSFKFWVSVRQNLFTECTLTQKENKNTKIVKVSSVRTENTHSDENVFNAQHSEWQFE
jgi:hypothetical protein